MGLNEDNELINSVGRGISEEMRLDVMVYVLCDPVWTGENLHRYFHRDHPKVLPSDGGGRSDSTSNVSNVRGIYSLRQWR